MVIRGRGAFRPELPAEMKRLERLNGVLPYKVFENIEHYSGLSDPQLADLLDVRPSRLADALAQLNQGEDEEKIAAAVAWFNEATGEDENADRNTIGDLLREANRGELLVRIPVYTGPEGELTSNVALVPLLEDGTLPAPRFHMNYVSVEGTIIIQHRDATSLAAIRRRAYEDVRKDHNGYAPQLTHTHQQNGCLVAMSLHGYPVSAGYRGALYLPGGQQLVPDARLTAHVCIRPLNGAIQWYVEYERSATTPVAIRNKLMPYFRAVSRGYDCPVIVICETQRAEQIFRQQHGNLQRELGVSLLLITSTYAQVTAGDQFDTCWDLDGHPVRLI